MKHFKINIGRKELSSDYIRSKQNFDGILQKIQSSPSTSIWKLWSYGISSLAGLALLVGIYYTDSNRHVVPNVYAATNSIARPVEQTNFEEIQNHQTRSLLLAMNTPCDLSNQCTHLKSETTTQCVIKNKKKTEKKDYIEQRTSLSDQNISAIEQQNKSVAVTHALYIDRDKKGFKPSISGIYSGDIAWSQFNNSSVAIDNDHLQVSSFSIQYTSRRGDKTVAVQGNKIPKEVLADLQNIAIDQKIFITNVVANDKKGDKNYLTPMELNLRFDVLQPTVHEHDTTTLE